MASTRTQSVCDLLKGKYTDLSDAQLDEELLKLTNVEKSESESFEQLNKKVKDELKFEQNIKIINKKLIILYYIHNLNFKKNIKIRNNVDKIKNLKITKIKMFRDIKKANIQIAKFLFPQQKFNEDILIDIKTEDIYSKMMKIVFLNINLFNNYTNLETILTFDLLNNLNKNLISLIDYLETSKSGGSIKIKNNQKTFKNNQKHSKKIKNNQKKQSKNNQKNNVKL